MRKSKHTHISFVAAMSFSVILCVAPLFAQDADRGYELMSTGDFTGALEIFTLLVEKNPDSAPFLRMLGCCQYRLKKYNQAISAFNRSIKLEPFVKTDYCLRGKAYYTLGEYAKSIDDLENYMTSFPHDAPTRLILAVAYKLENRFDEAEKELKQVAKDSPTLEPVAKLQLASIAAREGNTMETADLFEDVRESTGGLPMQESILERIDFLEEKMNLAATQDKMRKWRASTSFGFVYSDNIMFLSDDVVTPEDTASGGDTSVFLTASGKYQVLKKGSHSLDGSANFYANKYFSEDEADVIRINPQIVYNFTGWKNWKLQSSLGLDEMMVDSDRSLRSVYFFQRGIKSWGSGMSSSVQYTYASNDYKDEPSPAEDRDGSYHTIQGTQYFQLGRGRKAYVGMLFKSNNTKGDEFESTTFGLKANFSHSFVMNTRINYYAKVDFTDYKNPSIYSSPADPKKRSDTTSRVSVSCAKDLSARLSVELSLAYSAKNSNISIYEYDKYVITPSMTYVF